MKTVQNGNTVQVHYVGMLSDGEVFDTSEGMEPLQFVVGENALIEGFEEAVIGMKEGETKTVTIPSDKAYGPVIEELIIEVPRAQLPQGDIEIGSMLSTTGSDGEEMIFTVTRIDEQSATLDMNHPLAGKDLTFKITMVKILD
ncbi:MAG: peptidyl-prolyl cis-trans isomerase [Vicingaceae bacterium]|jgi:FKBP-type peptidyl-prolyl cis-trans isomerase 2|nr:MAG: peptidyl-prolyl cis-trans isomerase [Vicingaceae bacterium]